MSHEGLGRQRFIRAVLGAGAGLAVSQLAAANSIASPPSTMGLDEAAAIRTTAAALASQDALYGGGVIRQAVRAQLQHCVSLLGARVVPEVRSDLFSADVPTGVVLRRRSR
ncbi:hypothetical protein [Actinokineospora sp. NBRC 105648]|uniref:hypothetical protein n=1 Tax=Actinokineospora sp. NBRC 105648 TaxID=3032206 RepID=UPI0024A3F3EF|nr:hypothetical protein [Actinokineospora sp. NBRC 105648]GLZ38186.1 hypothetical protein Acsp05_18100 [Actinokineospora sp. NBRC 105648]